MSVGGVVAGFAPTSHHRAYIIWAIHRIIRLFRRDASHALIRHVRVIEPIVLVARPPSSSDQVVVVLSSRVDGRPANLFFMSVTSGATPAPEGFFPCRGTRFITGIRGSFELLMVSWASGIRTRVFRRPRFAARRVFHRNLYRADIVLVTVHASRRRAFTIRRR